MKGLLNLLTVLAALLNFTAGCGLRAGGISGQRLLSLGAVLAKRRLETNNAGGTLQRVGAVLGEGSAGSLIGGIASLGGGGVGNGLITGTSGIASNGATSGIGALRAQLGGATGESLLYGLGAAAISKLRARGSSDTLGSSGSGPAFPMPGINQVQGAAQSVSQRFSGAVFVSHGASTNSATTIAAQPVGIPSANLQSATASQNAGALMPSGGLVPSGTISGGHPGAPVGVPVIGPGGVLQSGVAAAGAGMNQVQRFAHSVQHASQTIQEAAIANGGDTGSSGARMGVPPGGNTAPNQQSAGAGQVGNGLIGSSGLSPMDVGSGLPGAQGGVLGIGAGRVLQDTVGTVTAGVQQAQTVAQSVHQASQLVGGAVVGAGGASSTPSMGRVRAGNSALDLQGAAAITGGGAPIGANAINPSGDGSGPGLIPSSNPVQGLAQGAREMAQGLGGALIRGGSTTPQFSPETGIQTMARSTQSLLGVASTVSGSVSGIGAAPGGVRPRPTGAGPGPGAIPGSNLVQGMAQGTRHMAEVLGGTITGGGRTTQQSAPGTGEQFAASSSQSVLSVASRVNGVVSGLGAPSARVGPGRVGVGPGPAPGLHPTSNLGQGLEQGISQIGQGVGAAISGGGSTMLQSTSRLGVHMLGSSTQNLQGVASSISGGVPGAGTPRGGMGLSPSGAGPGWNPGLGSGQPSQPASQMPGGGSYVAVSTSSHSSSSFHTRVSGASSVGGLATSPGGSGSGSTLPNAGGGLLGAILPTATGGAQQGGPVAVGASGLSVLGSSVGSGSVSSGVISGIGQHRQLPQRGKMSAAAVAGLTLGSVAGAVALSAIGATLASAAHSGRLGGGRRLGGCSGGGCSGGCGRKRRSLSQSRVPAEVLNNIHMNFDRLY